MTNGASLRFCVDGTPQQQGSKRHVGGGRLIESNDKLLRPWRERVENQAREAAAAGWPTFYGPVRVELLFRFTRPKVHFGTGRNRERLKPSAPDYKSTMPDLDKLARAVIDSLVDARVIGDDGQVAVLVCDKRFGERPGVIVEVRPLE